MRGFESIKMAIFTIWSNKMRTALTMLGIIIGISSVIALVGIGQGSQKKMQSDFATMGVNRATLYMNYEKNADESDYYNRRDVETIRRIYGNKLRGISTLGELPTKYFSGKKEIAVSLYAVNETYDRIDSFKIEKGRFLTKSDVDSGKAVAVLDVKFADKILKTRDLLGKRITLQTDDGSSSFLVVGLYSKPATMMMGSSNTYSAFIPVSYLELQSGTTNYGQIEVSFLNSGNINNDLMSLTKLIEKRHNQVGNNLYMSYNAEREMAMMNKITGSMTLLVSVIAGISLVVGGIGIMNIMLVSVTERTREIGIRKAIGATRMDILSQFLIESAIVSSLGGLVGILFGIGLGNLIGMFMKIPPVISPSIMFIAVAFSCGLGIFFGIYPADKASKLDPIDALRFE